MESKTLKHIVIACLSFIPFIAWIVSDGRLFDIFNIPGNVGGLFFPFISGKNFYFRAVVEIAFIAWIFLLIKAPEYRPKKNPIFISYALFVSVLLIADLFGANPFRSFFSNYERMEGFVMHIHMFAYFVMMYTMLRKKEDWVYMFKYMLVSNICVLFWAYMQLLGNPQFWFSHVFPKFSETMRMVFPIHMSENRLDSTLGNSAYMAIYAVLFSAISMLMYVTTTSKNWKIISIILFVLNIIALYFTATRGSIIGMVVGVFVGGTVLVFSGSQKEKKVAGGILACVIAMILVLYTARNSSFVAHSPILSRFAGISATDMTTMSRVTLWKMSFEGFKENPILGFGQDNFSNVFARHFNPKMYAQEPWFDRSHDVFFDWLIAGGVCGLLSYLSLFVVATYSLYRKGKDGHSLFSTREKAIIIGVLVAYFIHNVLVFDNLVSYILFFAILAYIASKSVEQNSYGNKKSIFDEYQILVVAGGVIVTLLLFIFSVYKPYMANKTLVEAINVNRLFSMYTPDKAVLEQKRIYEKALAYDSFGSSEIREQLIQSVVNGISVAQQIQDPATKNEYFKSLEQLANLAKNEIQVSLKTEGDDVRALGLFGSFYNSIGDYVTGEKLLRQAYTLAPKKQRNTFTLLVSLFGLGKYNEAYDLAVRMYNDAPAYDEARTILGVLAAYTGKENEALALFTQNGQTFPLTGEIMNAYTSSKTTKRGIEFLREYKKGHASESVKIDELIAQLSAVK